MPNMSEVYENNISKIMGTIPRDNTTMLQFPRQTKPAPHTNRPAHTILQTQRGKTRMTKDSPIHRIQELEKAVAELELQLLWHIEEHSYDYDYALDTRLPRSEDPQ